MKVQLVTPYRVSHVQSYGVAVCGNVTSVYPHLTCFADLAPRLLHELKTMFQSRGIT